MKKDTLLKALNSEIQRAKEVVSDSFSIGLVIFVFNLPDRQVLFFGEIQITEGYIVINPANQKGFWG